MSDTTDTMTFLFRRHYPQKPWWERWCFMWRCFAVEMRHNYGYEAWGVDCDHRGRPAACTQCDAPVCMICHRRRGPHPSGEIKTVGGHWCDAPVCVADELEWYGVVPRWRVP